MKWSSIASAFVSTFVCLFNLLRHREFFFEHNNRFFLFFSKLFTIQKLLVASPLIKSPIYFKYILLYNTPVCNTKNLKKLCIQIIINPINRSQWFQVNIYYENPLKNLIFQKSKKEKALFDPTISTQHSYSSIYLSLSHKISIP